jgi:PPOX class probable FMN-dependent enzyme
VTPHLIASVDELREVIAYNETSALKLGQVLDQRVKDFIAESPFVVLSTSDGHGSADASPKGDAPGFVLIEDDRTLVIPDRPGNSLAFGLTNILENPGVGLLFLIPGTTETLRVNGRAELDRDPELLDRLGARGKPAVVAIRVHVEQVFFHCAKAFIRSELWKPDTWPPKRKVSFGAIVAPKLGDEVDPELVKAIDDMVDEDSRVNL